MVASLLSSALTIPIILALACTPPARDAAEATNPLEGAELRTTVLVTGLATPWDLAWGPDAFIWVSERGGRISRVNPANGQRTTIGQLTVTESGESGLMGIAFHPDFATQPFLYAMHSYSAGGVRNRLVRMRYQNGTLGAPEVLLDGIPGGGIHDGSRIAVGPDRLLYISTGDAGDGSNAQDFNSLAGKILRLTLDGRPAPGNAFPNGIYSLGHRNPQGMVFHPVTGALYITEHGPGDNDEVNRVIAGRNHGWPTVHGFCDDDVGNEKSFCQASNVVEPLHTWTPTIAPSGADFYNNALIPSWKGSLLFTSLRDATLHRLRFSPDGNTVVGDERLFSGRFGRLRDVLVAPNGQVYIATSNRDGRGSPSPDDDRIIRIDP